MTTQITPNDKFLGYPAMKLKTLLRVWARGTTEPPEQAELKTLGMTAGACAAFTGECLERGFIQIAEPEFSSGDAERDRMHAHLELSPAGTAIAAASGRKRSAKAKAAQVLDQLLSKASRLAADRYAPMVVDQVWVFGSFIDDAKKDVGDLDVVVTTDWTDLGKEIGFRGLNRHIARHYPGIVPENTQYFRYSEAWLDRMLYGKRRDPLIAANDLGTLKSLHRPCRLVYDAKQGGKITPQDFAHHPESEGRADHIRDPLVLPDLSTLPPEFKPTPAAVYMWAPEMKGGFPAVIGRRTLDPIDLRKYGNRNMDGYRGFALVVRTEEGQGLFHVTRDVSFSNDAWDYRMNIEAVHLPRGFNPGRWEWYRPVATLESLFGADVLRLADRRDKMEVFPTITATLRTCGRTRRCTGLMEQMDGRLENILSSEEKELLPKSYRHGIDVCSGDYVVCWHQDLECFDDCDWESSGLSRTLYEQWADSRQIPTPSTAPGV